MKTQHTHDCDACIFLGNLSVICGDISKRYDIYLCASAMGGPDVVARYGSDGPEYRSVPLEVLNSMRDPSDLWVGVRHLLEKKERP